MKSLHIITKSEVFVKILASRTFNKYNLYIYRVMNEEIYFLYSTVSPVALARPFTSRRRRP
jgi:hypothetical protein